MTAPPSPFAAIITAGGASRRFGRDKALHPVEGRTLLDRVAHSLQDASPRVLVAPAGRYTLEGWSHVPDTRPGEGPLAGLEAGLHQCDGWAAFAAVDYPFLTAEFWHRLARYTTGTSVVCPVDAEGRAQPLAALYHRSLLPAVTGLLDGGERSMRSLLGSVDATLVPWTDLSDLGPRLLRNVNRPEDLRTS